MKIVFFGTPNFALPVLNALLSDKRYTVMAVVTQPDKPGNRGVITQPPVKLRALESGIPVLQFNKIRVEGVSDLKSLNADIGITVAYGQILSQEIIDVFPYGIYNVHASILPAYRGSSPIQWAIIKGEKKTGITIMKTDVGIDTGNIISQRETSIDENCTAGELFEVLSQIGAELLLETLPSVKPDTKGKAQNSLNATHYPMITKETGIINFNNDAKDIHNLVRGLNPSPYATAVINGQTAKIIKTKFIIDNSALPSGSIISADSKNGLKIKCGKDAIEVLELQMPNSRIMTAKDYLLGHKINLG